MTRRSSGRERPSYDETEYRSRNPQPPASTEPSLFAETQEYLAGAEDRISELTPLEQLQAGIDAVAAKGYGRLGAPPPLEALRQAAEAKFPPIAGPGIIHEAVKAMNDFTDGVARVMEHAASQIVKPTKHSYIGETLLPERQKPSKAERGLGAVLKKNPPKGTVRHRDHGTSLEAALAVEPQLSKLHEQILAAFTREGPMHDERLERLPEFRDLAPSTARKRRSELVAKGKALGCGKAYNAAGSARLTLWDLSERVRPEKCAACGQPTYWQSRHEHACAPDPEMRMRIEQADPDDSSALWDTPSEEDAEPLDTSFREEDDSGRTIGERFNDSEATY